jgi:hypothetical protein
MTDLPQHPSPAPARFADLPAPALTFFADLSVQVGTPVEVGTTAQGVRRLIPIVGGHAAGHGWVARVLPGGCDFQLIVSPTLAHLDARYVLETDAGDMVYVQNRALRSAPADVMARLQRGEAVPPEQVYFRCHPQFETASPALAWATSRLFVGTGQRQPHQVDMRFFELG